MLETQYKEATRYFTVSISTKAFLKHKKGLATPYFAYSIFTNAFLKQNIRKATFFFRKVFSQMQSWNIIKKGSNSLFILFVYSQMHS